MMAVLFGGGCWRLLRLAQISMQFSLTNFSCGACGEAGHPANLGRRQWVGAALLSALAWPAAAFPAGPEAAVSGARDVCVECLVRRAQQRSPFVNKEAA